MLYEIHMLKNYPPVNLNRDDTGSPKTCFFGGSQRGRISSQCLKHTWRTSELYKNLLGNCGIRTRALPELVRNELITRGAEEAFAEEAAKKASGLANKDGKESDTGATGQMIFYSADDIKAVADKMESLLEEKGSLKAFAALKAKDIAGAFKDVNTRPVTLDIAMFGRMVTSDVFRNVEAAVQVAHAVSIHTVNQESDYFTAADDLLREGETGAGMIGDIDYNSCCYYFYVSIDTDILAENLKDSPDAAGYIKDILPAFIKLMAFSDPTGKQNSFAGHVLPSLICVEKKETKIPVSLVNAFAKPVNARRGEVVKDGADALKKEIDTNDKCFGIPSERFWFTKDGFEAPEKGTVCASVQELCEKCAE